MLIVRPLPEHGNRRRGIIRSIYKHYRDALHLIAGQRELGYSPLLVLIVVVVRRVCQCPRVRLNFANFARTPVRLFWFREMKFAGSAGAFFKKDNESKK